MRCEHVAIDGSLVSIEAEADLSRPYTASGWAIVPSLMRPHPFSTYAAGHGSIVERAVSGSRDEVQILSKKSYSLGGRELRVFEAEVRGNGGGRRRLSVGAWEGETACLATSVSGRSGDALPEIFETVRIRETKSGLSLEAPVTLEPRVPQILKQIPQIGIVSISPAVAPTLETIPRARGCALAHGEVFRTSADSRGLLFVGQSVVARIQPRESNREDAVLSAVSGLRIQWTPRD